MGAARGSFPDWGVATAGGLQAFGREDLWLIIMEIRPQRQAGWRGSREPRWWWRGSREPGVSACRWLGSGAPCGGGRLGCPVPPALLPQT